MYDVGERDHRHQERMNTEKKTERTQKKDTNEEKREMIRRIAEKMYLHTNTHTQSHAHTHTQSRAYTHTQLHAVWTESHRATRMFFGYSPEKANELSVRRFNTVQQSVSMTYFFVISSRVCISYILYVWYTGESRKCEGFYRSDSCMSLTMRECHGVVTGQR